MRRESGVRLLARGENDVLVKDISDTFTRRLVSRFSSLSDIFPFSFLKELDSPEAPPALIPPPPEHISCFVSASVSGVKPGSSCKHQAALQKLVHANKTSKTTPTLTQKSNKNHPDDERPLQSGCRGRS